jgi:hypothetical protein
LECAAVVCYSRPFIQCRSTGRISANYEKFEDENHRKLHAFILDHRNAFGAHSDMEKNVVEIALVKGKLAKWDTGQGTIANHGQFIESQTVHLQVFPLFKSLCEFQLDRITTDVEAEKDRLFP